MIWNHAKGMKKVHFEEINIGNALVVLIIFQSETKVIIRISVVESLVKTQREITRSLSLAV